MVKVRFDKLTNVFHLIAKFHRYKQDSTAPTRLCEEDVTALLNVVSGKRNLDERTSVFRSELQKCKKHFDLVRQRRFAAERDCPKILQKVKALYWLTELMIDGLKQQTNRYNYELKLALCGRQLGLGLNDLKALCTGVYSLNALRQRLAGMDKKLNTNEHFHSLYATVGPSYLRSAVENPSFDHSFESFLIFVFTNTQTIRTTKEENIRLAEYHKQHEMVSPQHSYQQVGITTLIQTNGRTPKRRQWHFILNDMYSIGDEVDGLPFDTIISIEEAIATYPELKGLAPF